MKQQKRKGFEWYRMLTKKQQKEFRLNCIRLRGLYRWKNVLNDVFSYYEFIGSAFSWLEVKEGPEYWIRISNLDK